MNKTLNNNPFFWSEIEDSLLKQSYLNKIKKSDILNLFPNRTYAAIKYRAKVLGIKKCRLQYKNELFFEIPNEMNCSIAGMIASDGNVQVPKKKNSYRIIIGLQQNDKEILENILKVTNSNATIRLFQVTKTLTGPRVKTPIEKEYFGADLTFSGAQKWMSDLQKWWNITPNKSLTMTAPNINDLNLSLAYIVGLINGDGSIGYQKAKDKKYLYIRVLGTRNLIEWVKARFKEFLNEDINGEVRPERPESNIYLLQINGIQAIKLFETMNNINCTKLNRKWSNPDILNIINDYKNKNPLLFSSNSV